MKKLMDNRDTNAGDENMNSKKMILTTDEKKFIQMYRDLPEWAKPKMRRFVILLNNGSKKAARLLTMAGAGQISLLQMLRHI